MDHPLQATGSDREETKLEALSTKLNALTLTVHRFTGNLMCKTDTIFGGEPKDIKEAEKAATSDPEHSFYRVEASVHRMEVAVNQLEVEVCRYTESGL